MSDQRRMVESDTPRWRAASEVVTPSLRILFIGEVYGGFAHLSQPRCDFAQVRQPEASVAVRRWRRDGPPGPARPLAEALARGGGPTPRAGRRAALAPAAGARRDDPLRRRDPPARAARLPGLRGLGRQRQGWGDQAAGRPHRPAPPPLHGLRRADGRREAPPLPAPLRARA